MTAPRPIRPIDGNALFDAVNGISTAVYSNMVWVHKASVISHIKAAPTLPQPEPVAVGDAISREAAIETLMKWVQWPGQGTLEGLRAMLDAIPSIPCAQPEAGVDVVTVDDVVEGISYFGIDFEKSAADELIRAFYDWPKQAIADLLNGALRRGETVTWPEGHRRNPTPKKNGYEKFAEFTVMNHAVFSGWADDELISWYEAAPAAHKVASAETFAQLPREVKVILCSNTAALNDCKPTIERERKRGGNERK